MVYYLLAIVIGVSCLVAGWCARWDQQYPTDRPLILHYYDTLFGLNSALALFGSLALVGYEWFQSGWQNAALLLLLYFVLFQGGPFVVGGLISVWVRR